MRSFDDSGQGGNISIQANGRRGTTNNVPYATTLAKKTFAKLVTKRGGACLVGDYFGGDTGYSKVVDPVFALPIALD